MTALDLLKRELDTTELDTTELDTTELDIATGFIRLWNSDMFEEAKARRAEKEER